MNDRDPLPPPAITDEEWAAAIRIVTQAIRDYAGVLPEAQLEAYRNELLAHLTADPAGRALLRRTLADPVVEASDDVAKEKAPAALVIPTKKASG